MRDRENAPAETRVSVIVIVGRVLVLSAICVRRLAADA